MRPRSSARVHGEQGLSLQRDAQRLLEQTNSGQSGSGDSDGKRPRSAAIGKESPPLEGQTDADRGRRSAPPKVPWQTIFGRRVLEGLSKEQSGRLSDAVRRYAEGLLQ